VSEDQQDHEGPVLGEESYTIRYKYDEAKVIHFDGVHMSRITRHGKSIVRAFLYDIDFGPREDEVTPVQISTDETVLQTVTLSKNDDKIVKAILVLDEHQLRELGRLSCKALGVEPPSGLLPPSDDLIDEDEHQLS